MVEKIRLMELNKNFIAPIDLFICCASFEERSTAIASSLDNRLVKKAWVIYNPELENIDNNLKILKKVFNNKLKTLKFENDDILFLSDAILRYAKSVITENMNIIVDITTFTHELLLILYKILIMNFADVNVTFLYCNALEYSSGEEKKWLSKGNKLIRSVLGYGGEINPLKKTHLIVIVGYEYERAIGCINMIEPNSLSLCYGRSDNSTTEKDKDANSRYLGLVEGMASSYKNLVTIEIPCDDPVSTMNVLIEDIEKHNDDNIIIVPLNNKLSTLGIAMLASKYDKVQVCYSPALIYNVNNYSTTGCYCYIVASNDATELV